MYAPSSIVLPESWHNQNPDAYQSSWTYKGEPIPFAPIEPLSGPSVSAYSTYFTPLLRDSIGLNHYGIPVDNIVCPVQLISGKDDQFWPSSTMAEMIKSRMRRNPDVLVFHDSYEGVGHQFLFFGDDPIGKVILEEAIENQDAKFHFNLGGSEAAMWAGMIRGRDRSIYFLNKVKL